MLNKLKKIDDNLLLLIWIYLNSIVLLLDIFMPGIICSYIKYVLLIILLLISGINNRFSISRRLMFFSIVYFLALMLNVLLVDYSYYVLVEGLTNFLIFIPALYIINGKKFNLNKFIVKWKIFSLKTWYLIIPMLVLYYFKILDYSIFAPFLLPSILILSFSYFNGNKKDIKTLFISLLLIFLMLIFGGRMAGLAAVGIFIFCLIFVFKMETWKRNLTLLLISTSLALLIIFSRQIFRELMLFFESVGFNSRTLELMYRQVVSENTFSNIYLSNRESLYSQLGKFIKANLWLPNGISVARYLTNGAFYHPHSPILELLVMLGLPLTILVIIIFITSVYKFYQKNNEKSSKFLMTLIIFYLIRSILDTSIFNYYASIMIFAILFLYKNRELYFLNTILSKLINNVLWILPKSIAHRIFYFYRTKKILHLKKPVLFNEKLQWLIVNYNGQIQADLSDKYKVREYVKECGYPDILTKLYAVYKTADEIDFNTLPHQFVLKANNCSGGVYICKDKETFDFKTAKKELNRFVKANFGKESLEYHYSMIKPCIICEEYLNDFETSITDYKFYCFDGKCDSLLVCTERDKDLKLDYYDLDLNYLEFAKPKFRSNRKINSIKNFDKMIEIAEKLSAGFPFARIDLYNCDGKIYFGEITFTPYSGVLSTNTIESQIYYGNKLKLPIKKVKDE